MDTLGYFRDIVTTGRRAEELAAFDGKVVGTFCNFVPEELILAAGAVPVRLCAGDHGAAGEAETFLPRDLCSVVKSTAGLVQRADGLYGRADLLVMPTPCDGKKKLAGLLSSFKPVHILDLPSRKDAPGAKHFWLEQIKALQATLEKLTGQAVTRAGLRAAIELLNRRNEVFRRLHALRRRQPPPYSGEDALFIAQASFSDDVPRWIEHAEALCDELEKATPAANDGPRLLLTGAPIVHPNHKIIGLLEAAGAQVVADEMCSGGQRLYQPAVLRDWSMRAMIEAVAEKVMLPTTCPCFVDGVDRVNRILELAEQFQVDGVVYHSLRLCPLFEIESFGIGRELKERGLPMLTLNTDFSAEDTGQLRTRIAAFVEMVGA
jgi:benzoyl-CoA reductase/2-hydroxyglutaryl-CoA dehydratase subunit BcrC/BadD/HgdB